MTVFFSKALKFIQTRTYFLFPVGEESKAQKPAKRSNRREKGVAYLVVMGALSFVALLAVQTTLNTALNKQLSLMTQDKIKSEYNAKSGLNLGLYLFTITDAMTLYMNQTGDKGAVNSDSIESHWQLINGLPAFGSDTIAVLEKTKNPKSHDSYGLFGVMNEKNREIMNLFTGSFSVKIADENGKINVNNCITGRCEETVESLYALFSSPVEKAFLESKNINPKELAYRIKDFINSSPNASRESGNSNKNEYYGRQNPPYSAKAQALAELDELKLVQGWDDEIHEIFSPYLTIYPTPEASGHKPVLVNINTAKPELIASLVPSSLSNNCRDKFVRKMAQLSQEKQAPAAKNQALKLFFDDTLCYSQETSNDKEGDRKKWFTTDSKAFQFTIKGNTNKIQTKLKVVIQRSKSKKSEKDSSGQGQKRSFQILSWR